MEQDIEKYAVASHEDDGVERKRKRVSQETQAQEEGALEIDVNLPEPPSKKARRQERKGKKRKEPSSPEPHTLRSSANKPENSTNRTPAVTETPQTYGIWIGNLPFTATKDDLREFFKSQGGIDADSGIVRLHLPNPLPGARGPRPAQNRGFAYIDFATEEVLAKALALSETLLSGRKVLIKDSKNFEGRPQKPAGEEKSHSTGGGKEPSKRIFVGNLGFDVTREDVVEHFTQAGEVEDVFLATFEDSGKCKGFGWVRLSTIEAAENAVRGYIYKEPEVESDDEVDSDIKKPKREKKFINRLHGRTLRCEFAEDAQTRYQKRFKSNKPAPNDNLPVDPLDRQLEEAERALEAQAQARKMPGWEKPITRSETQLRRKGRAPDRGGPRGRPKDGKEGHRGGKEERREESRKRHDARTVAPGKALAFTPRASGAIVEGKGKKISFD